MDSKGLKNMKKFQNLSERDIDRIIEMAWEDRTPFDAIESQFGVKEAEVIQLMRREMKRSSFKMWRARVQGRKTKHAQKSPEDMDRFKSNLQRSISMNKISKK
ncbi:TIGR03643 family protein [Algoriphagus ornithinivorans]|uniref:TIGR03643 family protein n=2 Tax=Cyclobacteriaceae TaxID=563798 RepID=A0A1I5CAC0_9BACT|nr:TIGR03643 family protein [Algoriphagus ornithinivorans]